jgi:hypothetical protein
VTPVRDSDHDVESILLPRIFVIQRLNKFLFPRNSLTNTTACLGSIQPVD